MATLSKLKAGQIVYSVERQQMGNTSARRNALYEVRIVEIRDGYVIASWNGNPPRSFNAKSIAKWKVKKPAPKGEIFGLPTY
jgi:hypothetical protein